MYRLQTAGNRKHFVDMFRLRHTIKKNGVTIDNGKKPSKIKSKITPKKGARCRIDCDRAITNVRGAFGCLISVRQPRLCFQIFQFTQRGDDLRVQHHFSLVRTSAVVSLSDLQTFAQLFFVDIKWLQTATIFTQQLLCLFNQFTHLLSTGKDGELFVVGR